MPLSVTCPGCAWTGKAPEAHAGRRVKCPKCGEGFTVPRPGETVTSDVYGLEPEPEPPPKPVVEDDEAEAGPARGKAGKKKKKRKGSGGRSWGAIAVGCVVGLVVGGMAAMLSERVQTGGQPRPAARTPEERARAAGRASASVVLALGGLVAGGIIADRRSRQGR
jgi:ribosomal protein S27E